MGNGSGPNRSQSLTWNLLYAIPWTGTELPTKLQNYTFPNIHIANDIYEYCWPLWHFSKWPTRSPDMMTSSNGNIFRVTGHLCGVPDEFPAQRPVTRSFDVFFDLRLNKRLSKQSWGWWFETPSRLLWRHRNEILGVQAVCPVRAWWPSLVSFCLRPIIPTIVHSHLKVDERQMLLHINHFSPPDRYKFCTQCGMLWFHV